MTGSLLRMKGWLIDLGITHVAMESIGPYWKPVFNILEDSFEVILANARHFKNVPGRKTDVKDSEWICKLLRSGLLTASFVPPQAIRDLRDLTRYQWKLTQAVSAEKNRIQKVLEDANVKLSSVASDTFGVSAGKMVRAIISGNGDPVSLADLAVGRLKSKKDLLRDALQGHFRDHHGFMIQASLDHIEYMEKVIASLDQQINEKLNDYHRERELMESISAVKEQGSASILAEIGADRSVLPSADHISALAVMSPGNNESAGKEKVAKQSTAIKI
jgi:transposase